jgi:hypothetical protein
MIVANPILELANAIIVQAATDYRNALLGDAYRGKSPEVVISECERFFRSEWYRILTEFDGEVLMEKIQKEVKQRRKQK